MKESIFKTLIFRLLIATSLMISGGEIMSQPNRGQSAGTGFSTYYHQRQSLFENLPARDKEIWFIGNSITDGGEWTELFNDVNIKNRGISGDGVMGILNRLDGLIGANPTKVFLMIGVNDLARGSSVDSVYAAISRIITRINNELPATKIFLQSVLPVNNTYTQFPGHVQKQKEILSLNKKLKNGADERSYRYIDLYNSFTDSAGNLSARYTNDGLHLTGEAYLLWKHLVFPFVYDLQEQAEIIPLPQSLSYSSEKFFLFQAKAIFATEDLRREAEWLQQEFIKFGYRIPVVSKMSSGNHVISLELARVDASMHADEAYSLAVHSTGIRVRANAARGIHYGLQTLMQLFRDGIAAGGCTITDWPAYAWRGYMIDVGRNYMSMDRLKVQIDELSRYKYNIFHFHLTEDIAWRIAIDQYPGLTAPETMIRNRGMYYTKSEMHELIKYCADRYITLVPEIDMPGHSAAFTRAMGFDMQSDSGLAVVKNILRELVNTYELPYWHIGADEVEIRNKNFLPEISALMESMGRKIIGWEPGGNFTKNTIRQLWMDDNGKTAGRGDIRYIDSRHLYINHLDPLEAVTTIFFRQIASLEAGNDLAMGGTLCMWHDRAVDEQDDIFRMNPVYPAIASFGERVWRGGGRKGWISVLNPADKAFNEFAEFENRLLGHKKLYFNNRFFPYQRQQGLRWKLYGPYNNNGNTQTKFPAEDVLLRGDSVLRSKITAGATVVLRHWWAPQVTGVLDNPEDSSTWYASTKIWADTAGVCDFWIGFNNLSRSPATDSPPEGLWNSNAGQLWVNGEKIPPPQWRRAGQRGHPEIPLADEGYEYRTPTKINLRQGWNNVLVKIPVASFRGRDWQNPVKWMFSFTPVGH